ncbi:MAG: hypothetical protein QNJ62_05175 [Methyloceanibacter sp.]|nr:hypothetical protein [Methyloceanibacter sp.]
MTLLSICQEATNLAGVLTPDSIVGNSEDTAQRLLASANATGKELLKVHRWAVLQEEHPFPTVADQPDYPLPDDYDRMMDFTAWDRTHYWRIRGSISPQEWQLYKSGAVGLSLNSYKRFRLKASSGTKRFFIDPTPKSAENLIFEYVSSHWCEDSGGTGQAMFAADSDNVRLPEHLFVLGVHWRLLRSFGQPYIDERNDYQQRVLQEIRDDKPGTVIGQQTRVKGVRIPEGNWLQ